MHTKDLRIATNLIKYYTEMAKKSKYSMNKSMSEVYRNIESQEFIDPKRIIADLAVRLTVGRGYNVSSENIEIKKWLFNLLYENNFRNTLERIVWYMSYYGRAIVTISKTEEKDFFQISLIEEAFLQAIGDVNEEPGIAVIWKIAKVDNMSYWIREKWDVEKVTRELYDEDKKTKFKLMDLNSKVPKSQQLPEVWYHNLGFVPIIIFYNKPWSRVMFSAFQKTLSSNILTDDYSVKHLPMIINHTYRQLFKSLILNQPKIIGALSAQTQQVLLNNKEKGGMLQLVLENLFIATETGVSSSGTSESIGIMKPVSNHFSEMQSAIDRFLDTYFEGCGYSRDSSNVVDKATNALISQSKDQQTTKRKVEYIQSKLTKLLKTLLISTKKIKKDEFDYSDPIITIHLKENLQISELEETNIVIQKVTNNLMSYSEGIAVSKGISIEDAKIILKDILEEKKLVDEASMQTEQIINPKGVPGQGEKIDKDNQGTKPKREVFKENKEK